MDLSDIGKWLLVAGLGLAAVGGVIWLIGRVPGAGRLPGDINVQVGGITCIAPLLTMLIVSVVLTVVVNLLLRLFQK